MLVDAVLPAASEAVMVYGGAVAAGAFAGQDVRLFGWKLEPGFEAYLAIALAGTIGYTVGGMLGWWVGFRGGRFLGIGHHTNWPARACGRWAACTTAPATAIARSSCAPCR